MKSLPAVDVVIVGGGWAGLLMAKELGSRTSLSVAVLERGEPRKTEDYADTMDELDYSIRMRLMQDLSQETVTLRYSTNQRALPLRQHGSFLPGAGVGGAGEHWNGTIPRFQPDIFELRSRTIAKYGPQALPEDHAVQDWGITYEELEPYYSRADLLLGSSGKAGNIHGKQIEGGNIFEGWRSAEYPNPTTKIPYFSSLFHDAAKSLGYHPYPNPAATLSRAYTNPDGVARGACAYCGFCDRFGCMIGAKAQPTNTLLPVIQKHKNVSLRTGAWVRRVVHDGSEDHGKARGVTYIDAAGQELFQPANLVLLCSWTLSNTKLLLLSAPGRPYDPATGQGTLGSNLTHQLLWPGAIAFFDKPLNRFMGSGAAGIVISDLDGDVFDHGKVPFVRGGSIYAMSYGYRPIASFGVLPSSVQARWGSEWKKAALWYYDRTGRIAFSGEHLSYKSNYMDLDPTYKDRLGDPLLRLTLDWRENERNMAEFATRKIVELARAMGAKEILPASPLEHYDTTRYQSTHVQGGAIMGATPEHSVVNSYFQHWQVENLFVVGASAFPQNASANPTLTLLALGFRAADAIVDRYLKAPGPLA
jgi:gluconate 2-dehydrogenase alpha chain